MPILLVFVEIDCESRIWGETSLFPNQIYDAEARECGEMRTKDLRVFQLACEAKLVLVKSNEFLATLTEQHHPDMKPS